MLECCQHFYPRKFNLLTEISGLTKLINFHICWCAALYHQASHSTGSWLDRWARYSSSCSRELIHHQPIIVCRSHLNLLISCSTNYGRNTTIGLRGLPNRPGTILLNSNAVYDSKSFKTIRTPGVCAGLEGGFSNPTTVISQVSQAHVFKRYGDTYRCKQFKLSAIPNIICLSLPV